MLNDKDVATAAETYQLRYYFLRAMRLSHRNSVCPFIRPSHWWISQKWCKLGLPNCHRWLPGRL